jgi:tetratricopeptide (TPR) repeat protein
MPVLADFYTPRPETGFGLDGPGGSGQHPVLAGSQVTVLTGPGGLGKTYLAAAKTAGLLRSGGVDLAVWIHASSRAAVLVGYAQAAAELGLAHATVPAEAAATVFLDWLGRAGRRWLVVLDHVPRLAGLADVWPVGPAGQVIVTCREHADTSAVAGSHAPPVICPIGAFSPREALGFLTARLHADTDQRVEAVDLADDMGQMPLALALASATMAGSTLSCREYRHRYAARGQELAGQAADGGKVTAVEAAWSLALDRAEQRAAGLAHPLLALAALLDSAGVPAQLPASEAAGKFLGGPAGCDPDQVRTAIGSLAGCGLVGVDESVTPPLLTIQPVIQATAVKLFPAAVLDEAAHAAADALDEVWPVLDADPVQAQALRDCTTRLDATAGDLLWSPGPHPVLIRAGASQIEAGLVGPALAYWQALLDQCGRRLGHAHAETLAIRERLAEACEAAGRTAEAIELARLTVADRERIQGTDHPDTLTARAALAGAYLAAGMTDAAIELYEQVLAGRQWVLGADHPEAMACRSLLAGAYLAGGATDRAISLYERNLAEWQGKFGPDHPSTLAEATSLGGAYLTVGKPTEAVAVFQQVRAIRERSLGRDHPDTLTALGQLAYAHRTAGRYKEAIPCYRETYAGRERTLGADHPDTLTALANLASCYQAARQTREAIVMLERVLAARERVQGSDHRDTLTARAILAGAYHSAGRLANAVPAYERAVADFERVLGPDHPDTLTSRGNLAHAYHMARRQTEAITVFEKTLADAERVLGPDHPVTRTIRENLEVAR